MTAERLPMRKIRDVLRLKYAGFSERQIAASLNIGATTAGEYIRRARQAGLAWPLALYLPSGATRLWSGFCFHRLPEGRPSRGHSRIGR